MNHRLKQNRLSWPVLPSPRCGAQGVGRQPAPAQYGAGCWPIAVWTFSITLALAAAAEPGQPPSDRTTTSAPSRLPPADCVQGVTPPQIEGPYYKPQSPERTSLLAPGMAGVKITLTGFVLNRSCQPIAGAWLDFWQANDRGDYDNRGYTLRGQQWTDAEGRYTLETILPGQYPGRPPHLHVKVRAPGQPPLTTQLYFPDAQPHNRQDPFFDPRLLVTWLGSPDSRIALYHFVLDQK